MTTKEFLKIRKQLEEALARIRAEALDDGISPLSKGFQRLMEEVKTTLLKEAGVSLEEYNEAELSADIDPANIDREMFGEFAEAADKKINDSEERLAEMIRKAEDTISELTNQLNALKRKPGPSGKDGKDGIDGKVGKSGKDGKIIFRGKKGDKGEIGNPGKDADITGLEDKVDAFSDNFEKNIEALSQRQKKMPDFRMLGMGLQAQIDENRGNITSGGYTNLTQFIDQTAWRLFYSNTDGDVTELALGTSGQYLKSAGTTSAPGWDTPGGGGDVTAAVNLTDNTIVQGDGGAKGVKTSTATVSQISTNVTHVAGNGSDHANVATNTTHGGLTNDPHSVTASQVGLGNVSNVATSDTAYNATSWNTNLDAATKNVIRDKVETMDTAIGLNTSKVTNVSTNLSAGTLTATTIDVNSSDGTNATLVEADTTNAGILGSNKWDEIVANSIHTAGDGSDHSDVAANTVKTAMLTREITTSGGKIELLEGTNNGTSKVIFQSPAALGADRTITIPDANADLGDIATNTTHRGLTDNPHSVDAGDVSLSNVTDVATSDVAYDATTWDANADSATKNAIRDKVETMDTAISSNTGASHAQSHDIASHSDTTATGAELDTLTGGGDTTLHDHDGISENTTARHTQNTDTALGSGAVAADHGTAATDQIINVSYGTGAAPTANTTTIGSLFIKYTN